MAIVFIEETNGPIRVCNKQATAEKLGIAWADVDLSELVHPTEHYTLSGGVLVELTDAIDAAALEVEKQWVQGELNAADITINKLMDSHGRTTGDVAQWRTYRNDLRDYIISDVIQGVRPTQPE
jgi:hypothetical protein